jgi:hypothetical protein
MARSDCFPLSILPHLSLGQPVDFRLRRVADDAQVAIADRRRPAALNRSRGVD